MNSRCPSCGQSLQIPCPTCGHWPHEPCLGTSFDDLCQLGLSPPAAFAARAVEELIAVGALPGLFFLLARDSIRR